MDYKSLNFKIKEYDDTKKDILLAHLNNLGFEGFLETDDGFVAYIPSSQFNLKIINILKKKLNNSIGFIDIQEEFIIHQNWNELWESNYDPVVIENLCLIKAPFHNVQKKYKYEITLEPKMSFGTGHHETTELVISLMLKENIENKTVLDMGCGTGILAILASKLGAKNIIAIDINDWAYENTKENCLKNNIDNVEVKKGSIEKISGHSFDVIIANITRNVLLEHFPFYLKSLNKNGIVILSGILEEDTDIFLDKRTKKNLQFVSSINKNGWIALKLVNK